MPLKARHNMIAWCPMMQLWEVKVNNSSGSPKYRLKLDQGKRGKAPDVSICKMPILNYLVEMVSYVFLTPKIWNRTASWLRNLGGNGQWALSLESPIWTKQWKNAKSRGQVGHLLQINTYLPLEAQEKHWIKWTTLSNCIVKGWQIYPLWPPFQVYSLSAAHQLKNTRRIYALVCYNFVGMT